jgi:histidyl-tRNA synthetase
VDVVCAAIDVLRAFGLDSDDFVARYSDRELIAAVLARIGIPEEAQPAAFAVLDKADRESEEWVRSRLAELGVAADVAGRVLELGGATLDEIGQRFGNDPRVESSVDRLRRFSSLMESAGLDGYVELDVRLVRGLAYYTGLVFELWDRRGTFRAICGGGRYDGLLEAVGGPSLPALGFGMGDVVLGELLRDRGLSPDPAAELDDFVIYVSEDELPAALRVVHALRARGRSVGYDYRGRSVGRQFKAADQAGARRVIVVGPEELARNEVTVRAMGSGEETTVGFDEILAGTSEGD